MDRISFLKVQQSNGPQLPCGCCPECTDVSTHEIAYGYVSYESTGEGASNTRRRTNSESRRGCKTSIQRLTIELLRLLT